jgi:peptide/nickel transport system substrate-binding protein
MAMHTARAKERDRRDRSRIWIAAVGIAAAVGLVVGATPIGASAPAQKVDPDGMINVPYDLAGFGGLKLDPTTVPQPDMWWVQQFIYDSLLRKAADGSFKPGIAKSATIKDPSTIEIELYPNQKFSDGTPLDAEAVKFSLERAKNSKNGSLRADIQQLGTVTVNSPTNLTISLLSPVANTFYDLLAYGETFIVSPTAVRSGTPLDQKPVGAGPFMLQSFAPESSAVFVKNPNFREAKKVKVGGFTLKQVSSETQDPQALVNAMLDEIGDITVLQNLSSVDPLVSGGIKVDQVATDSSTIFGPMCKNKPPFDDVRVRQALNYATDRDQIVQLMYKGKSEPTWATWTKGNALFNDDLDGYYDYNPKKAKQLLKEAGVEGLEFDMISNSTVDTSRISEILKEQWEASGITVNLVNTTNIVEDFFTGVKTPIAVVPVRRLGLDKITRNLQPGSIGDVCNYNDPELNALIDAVKLADPSSPDYKKAWDKLDAYVTENALYLFIVFTPFANAYNGDRIVKAVYRPDVFGIPRFDISKMSVKQG